MPPSVTILIASRDRVEALRVAVRSVFRLRRPAGARLQLVLVASASPATEAAARALADDAPADLRLTVGSLPRPGKSIAVNHGLTLSDGEVVAFTDDDVELDEGWLEGALDAFTDAAVDGVQGGVDVRLGSTAPIWWSRHCEALMASTVYLDERPPSRLDELNGCNMAVRRACIDRVGGLSPRLGPGVARHAMGEDTEWSRRLVAAGCAFVYRPAMRVVHHLPPSRVRLGEVLYRSYMSGWLQAAAYPACRPTVQVARTTSRLLIDGLRGLQRGLQGRWSDAADRLLWMARELGKLQGLLRGHPAGTERIRP